MVQAASDDSEVLVAAFDHAVANTLTVIAINGGTASKSVTLAGANLPATFQAYRTLATENCASVGRWRPSITSACAQYHSLVYRRYSRIRSRWRGEAGGIAPVLAEPRRFGWCGWNAEPGQECFGRTSNPRRWDDRQWRGWKHQPVSGGAGKHGELKSGGCSLPHCRVSATRGRLVCRPIVVAFVRRTAYAWAALESYYSSVPKVHPTSC